VERKLNAANHAEMRDLLGAFALGAVDAEEAAAVRAYVATNAEAQEELAELMAGVDVLALSITPLEPPAGLRDRIAAAALAEALPSVPPAPAQLTAIPHPPSPIPGPQSPVLRPPSSFWSRATPWAAAAAALLLITAGLLFWNLQLRGQLAATPVTQTIALAPTDAAPGASGEVRYLPGDQLFYVDVRDLPPLAEGQVYEVWLIGGDGPVPAGVFDRSTDQHAIVADRAQYDTLAITAEPGPLGTEAPTGEIVATAPL
jgi:anti-sigma-K factor RskA